MEMTDYSTSRMISIMIISDPITYLIIETIPDRNNRNDQNDQNDRNDRNDRLKWVLRVISGQFGRPFVKFEPIRRFPRHFRPFSPLTGLDIPWHFRTYWDILRHFKAIQITFRRVGSIYTVFPVISDHSPPSYRNSRFYTEIIMREIILRQEWPL